MTTMEQSRLRCELVKSTIGARVLNTKEELLSGALAEEIMDLLEQCGVIVFPQLNLTDDEQVAFTNTLGKFAHELRGEAVYKISLDPSVTATADYLNAAFFWHFDGFMSPMPIRASVMSAKVLSPAGTGNTEFANTYAAYEALSDEDKAHLADLRAVHALAATQLDVYPEPSYKQWQQWRAVGRKELPLVWTHRSGRKSLVIGNSAHNILDYDPLDGEELLVRLRDFATSDQFTYLHEWTVGDCVLWDNTGTLHRATRYDPTCGRVLHRTKIEGDEPIV
ncbi:TauD/TfdA family dioxygenase [Novosphingobium sp. TH158]|uniref:TauD/TfdA dioxygenase family protein n=1 Tax=Novosphingobium sp. TH158 TaxID=2067455 RepID=UPI000C7D3018|nr:TauD/TfdA family dioxygenase [Novosphingobium sp. TH158]PLK26787.1 taurine catabolism dioxygenase [Novosphingobium sp. TH158]